MLWLILCEFIEDFILNENFHKYETVEDLRAYADYDKAFYGNFLTEYEIIWQPHLRQTLIAMYFALTTMSTVGFGDYHPQNDKECFIGAFVLFFGFTTFSIIIRWVNDLINIIWEYNNETDYGEELDKFIGTM